MKTFKEFLLEEKKKKEKKIKDYSSGGPSLPEFGVGMITSGASP
jgi:hypothetical protein